LQPHLQHTIIDQAITKPDKRTTKWLSNKEKEKKTLLKTNIFKSETQIKSDDLNTVHVGTFVNLELQ
jgi:hypothetical protein